MESWETILPPFPLPEFEDMNIIQDNELLNWNMPDAPADPCSEFVTVTGNSSGDREGESVEFSLEEIIAVSMSEQQSLGEDPQPAATLMNEISMDGQSVAIFFENPGGNRGLQDDPSRPTEEDSSEISSSSSGRGTMSPEVEAMALIHEAVPPTVDPPKPKLGRPREIPSALALATPKNGKNPAKKGRAGKNFVPEEEKDEEYRRQRVKNNEAVRKSRAKSNEKNFQSALAKIGLKNTEFEMRWNELRDQLEKLRYDASLQGIDLSEL